jgi:hypothetical protein
LEKEILHFHLLKNNPQAAHRLLLISWLVLFFAFGLLTIKTYPPVNYNIGDEIWATTNSAEFAKSPRPDLVTPQVYFMTMGLYLSIAGDDVFAARSFSLIAATLVLYLTYLLGKELVDINIGLLSSVLLGTSFAFSWHSRVARSEMMTALLIVLAFYLLYCAFKYGKTRFLFYSSFLTVLSVNVHANSLQYVLGIVPVYMVLFRKRLLTRSTLYFLGGTLSGLTIWFVLNNLIPTMGAAAPPSAASTLKGIPNVAPFPVLNKNPFVLFKEILTSMPGDYLEYLSLFNAYFPNNIDIAVVAYTVLAVCLLSLFTKHRWNAALLLGFVAITSFCNYLVAMQFGYWHIVEFFPFIAIAIALGLYGIKEKFGKFQTVFLWLSILFFLVTGAGDTLATYIKTKDYDYERLLAKVSEKVDGRVLGMGIYSPAFKEEDFASPGFRFEAPGTSECPPIEDKVKELGVRYIIGDSLFRSLARLSCGEEYEKEFVRFLFLKCKLVSEIDESYPNYWADGIISDITVFEVPD